MKRFALKSRRRVKVDFVSHYDRVLDRTEQIREIRLEANVHDHGEKIHLESVVPVRILFPAGISDVD